MEAINEAESEQIPVTKPIVNEDSAAEPINFDKTEPIKPLYFETEKFTSSDYGARSIADVFGTSETELEDEFNAYKVHKLLSRVDELIDGDVSRDKISAAATNLRRFGFGALTVFPNKVLDAEHLLHEKGNVNALVGYPYGGEETKVLLYAIKRLKRTKARRIFVAISESLIADNKTAELKKFFKSAQRISKRFIITPTIRLDMNQTQLVNLVKCCLETGICAIAVRGEDFLERTSLTVKSLAALCRDKIKITALGEIDAKTAVRLFKAGVATLSSSSALALAEELEREIKRDKK